MTSHTALCTEANRNTKASDVTVNNFIFLSYCAVEPGERLKLATSWRGMKRRRMYIAILALFGATVASLEPKGEVCGCRFGATGGGIVSIKKVRGDKSYFLTIMFLRTIRMNVDSE